MWFKKKHVYLMAEGVKFELSWEEFGIYMAEVAQQLMLSDLEYLKNDCNWIYQAIKKDVSPFVTLSISFHLGIIQKSLADSSNKCNLITLRASPLAAP